jgi:hypothetical protein
VAKTTKKDDKVMDVAKPGTSAPDATARPVIVGHRAILQDPMVTSTQKDDEPEEKIVSKTAPTLKPIDNISTEPKKETKVTVKTEKADEKEAEKEKDDSTLDEGQAYVIETVKKSKLDVPKEEPDKKEAPAEAPAKKADEKPEPAAEEEKPEAQSDDQAATEAVAEQAAAKKTSEKEDKEATARQEAVQKLITEKTYNLPIGEAKRKRNMSLVVLLVLLIVAAALAYLAVDAGVIKTSVKLPYEFFK